MSQKYASQARVAIHEAGGQSRLAKELAARLPGLSENRALWRVQKWRYNGIPPEYVLHVEQISGVSRELIRPDLYASAPSS